MENVLLVVEDARYSGDEDDLKVKLFKLLDLSEEDAALVKGVHRKVYEVENASDTDDIALKRVYNRIRRGDNPDARRPYKGRWADFEVGRTQRVNVENATVVVFTLA